MNTKKNTNLDLKLHEINNTKLADTHTNELGFKIPENYFSNSKLEILNRIKEENTQKTNLVFKKKKNWMLAASLLFLLGLTIYSYRGLFTPTQEVIIPNQPLVIENKIIKKPQVVVASASKKILNTKIVVEKTIKKSVNIEENTSLDSIKNNLLVESLFIEDHQLNEYVTNYMLEDI